MFDSSPKWSHRHTICVGIEVSTKNRLEKIFIHFNNFNDFRELSTNYDVVSFKGDRLLILLHI
jgi:hypothetical protein